MESVLTKILGRATLSGSKSINSQLVLGNMQAQAPVHIANVQVGRGHRQLPSELDLPFSS